MAIDEAIRQFVNWFHDNQSRLRSADGDTVADEWCDRLHLIDERLGVEVGDEEHGHRDVIITAFSNADAFDLVQRIVDQLNASATAATAYWTFTALKPARGFEFTLMLNGQEVEASSLAVCPLADIPNGFQLLLPAKTAKRLRGNPDAEELAWLIVETGVGEALAARIHHLEFASLDSATQKFPIASLPKILSAN